MTHPDGYGGPTGSAPYPVNVLTVDIDTDALLQGLPGEEVAVNVAYGAGGLWHIETTCDTPQSGYACDWDIVVSLGGSHPLETIDGRATRVDGGAFRLVLPGQTSGDVSEFTGPPGESLRVDVILDGVHGNWANHDLDAWMVGWVEDNTAKYGAPSNPVDFLPTTP